jgi:putative hydrolase of the HAD superfamily
MSIEIGKGGDIEGIVFDAVGTLIEPVPSVALAYTQAALRQGIEVDPSDVKRRFHKYFRVDEVDEQLGPLATDESSEHRRWRRIVSNVLPDLPDPDRAFAELWDHFGRPNSWRAFDDVAPTLQAVREAGLEFVIASNFDARLRSVIAGLEALSGCDDRLVISSEVGFRKPHPIVYRTACKRLELPPERVLCVGDDPENDVRGPQRAGLRGLLIQRDSRSQFDLPKLPNLHALVSTLTGSWVK